MQQPPNYGGWQQPQQPNTQYPPQQPWQQQPQYPPPGTYYPPPMMPPPPPPRAPLPPPKKPNTWLIISIIVGGLIIIGALDIAKGSTSTQTNATPTVIATEAPTDMPVATATLDTTIPTDTPAPTQPPAKWTTTHTFTGNGNKKTAVFSVPDDWKILWSCTPSSSFGGEYNLILDVDNSDGTSLDAGAINTICKNGNTHDETEEHQSGDIYLDIESEGAWKIQIQEFK